MTVFLGLDVGGTSLRAQLDAPGSSISVELTSSSWLGHESATITEQLQELFTALPLVPDAVCVGASGCETPADAQRIQAGVQPVWPRAQVRVVNDAELVLPAAGMTFGTVVVAGTGAIAFGIQADGSIRRAGGWGPLIGDDGSAFHLVRVAARHVLARNDEGLAPDALTDALQRAADAPTVPDLMHRLHAFESPAALARLAPGVCAVADAGDPVAEELVGAECAVLARLVHQVRGPQPGPVVCSGGLVTRVPYFAARLTERLAEDTDLALISVLRVPPVLGAVRLAHGLLTAGGPGATERNSPGTDHRSPDHRSQLRMPR